MVNTIDTALNQRPEALDCVGMGRTYGKDLLRMYDASVGISELSDKVIAGKLICVDDIGYLTGNLLPDDRQNCPSLNIGNNLAHYLPFVSVSQAYHWCFAFRTTPWLTLAFATNIGFVHLNRAIKGIGLLVHESSNLLEHSPCRFIGNSKLTLKLLGRDTASGRAYQEHGVEPRTKRSLRLMEDSIGSRRHRVTAKLTGINLRAFASIMLRYPFAVRAINALRIASLEKKLKASIVSRELLVEVLNRILISFHFSPLTNKYNTKVTVCQGIITLIYVPVARHYRLECDNMSCVLFREGQGNIPINDTEPLDGNREGSEGDSSGKKPNKSGKTLKKI